MNGSLAYIDHEKCRVCRKCEKVCPQHAIVAVNFPAPKPKPVAAPSEGEGEKETSIN